MPIIPVTWEVEQEDRKYQASIVRPHLSRTCMLTQSPSDYSEGLHLGTESSNLAYFLGRGLPQGLVRSSHKSLVLLSRGGCGVRSTHPDRKHLNSRRRAERVPSDHFCKAGWRSRRTRLAQSELPNSAVFSQPSPEARHLVTSFWFPLSGSEVTEI